MDPLVFAAVAEIMLDRRAEADSLLGILELRRSEVSPDERLWLDMLDAWVRRRDWQAQLIPLREIARRDPEALTLLANAALGAGRPEEALDALEEIDLRLDRNPYTLWFLLGACHMLGRHDEALAAAREGRRVYPNDLNLRAQEAKALVATGRLNEASPLFDEIRGMEAVATSWPPTPGHVLMKLAGDLIRAGYQEEGNALPERAIEWWRARDPSGYQLEIAQALLTLNRAPEALELLRPLAEESSENLYVRGTLGVALAKSGDPEGAMEEANWLGELDHPYLLGDNTHWRAIILAHLDRREEAVLLLGQAFEESLHQGAFWGDLFQIPLWGYGPFEQLIAPKG